MSSKGLLFLFTYDLHLSSPTKGFLFEGNSISDVMLIFVFPSFVFVHDTTCSNSQIVVFTNNFMENRFIIIGELFVSSI